MIDTTQDNGSPLELLDDDTDMTVTLWPAVNKIRDEHDVVELVDVLFGPLPTGVNRQVVQTRVVSDLLTDTEHVMDVVLDLLRTRLTRVEQIDLWSAAGDESAVAQAPRRLESLYDECDQDIESDLLVMLWGSNLAPHVLRVFAPDRHGLYRAWTQG